ncbi:MAG: sugar ABC transporter permease [Chloroflexota bacterium]
MSRVGPMPAKPKVEAKLRGSRGWFGRIPVHWCFIAPGTLYMLAITIYPVIYSASLSFTNASLIYPDRSFVGFRNYVDVLTDPAFFGVIKNTSIFVFGSVFFQILIGLGLAMAVNAPLWGRTLVRALILLTWVVPEIIVALIWRLMLVGDRYGIVNYALSFLKIGPIGWLTTPGLTMAVMIFVNNWRGTAFSVIMQLAALQSVPGEMYEAAEIDGASKWKAFLHITLPMIRATLLINLIMITLATFNVTTIVFSLTGGGPGRSTEVLALRMYNTAFKDLNVGAASAISMIMFSFNIVFTLLYIKFLRRGEETLV